MRMADLEEKAEGRGPQGIKKNLSFTAFYLWLAAFCSSQSPIRILHTAIK
jgi:hypothetical protein